MVGRNKRENADYFSHDSDASSDEKIVYLESIFGHKGYAVYFKFLERMTRACDFVIEWNDIKKAIYASEFSVSVTEIELIVTECCRKEIKAFEIKNGNLFSPGLKKRMQPLVDKRDYNRLKYQEKKEQPISVTEKTQSKVKESKGKKRKETNKKEKKLFNEDSHELRLSKYLYFHILQNNSNAKQPNFQLWAKYIDSMIKIDNRKPEDIKTVIKWSQNEPFWKTVILSTKNLRVKFDQVWVKMKNPVKQSTNKFDLHEHLVQVGKEFIEDETIGQK